jgi:iron complex transport system substrate-binding protein
MKTNIINGLGVCLSLGLATWGAAQLSRTPSNQANVVTVQSRSTPQAKNQRVVQDVRGNRVSIENYQRIVSVNTVADHVLLQILEPQRLVGITHHSRESHPESWRFGERSSVQRATDVEHILALKPDIVIISSFVNEAVIARLKEANVAVFDLGDTRGFESLLSDITALGQVLKVTVRAAQLTERIERELQALKQAVPLKNRPEGMYVSMYGDSFFGGTTNTSFADMLAYGGINDIASKHGYTEWPQYTPEQLLVMNPALIVTPHGMGNGICNHTLLHQLEACTQDGQVIEVSTEYISDPGLGIIQAAASIQAAVHP